MNVEARLAENEETRSRQAVDNVRRWRADPSAFVREVLKADPDEWQVEVLEAYRDGTFDRLCLKASKGPGKSTVLSWIVWHFLACYPDCKVVCTSVTGSNLKDGLWTELAKWQSNSPLLRAAFIWSAERIVSRDRPETWWCSARQWSHSANASQQADTLAGIHADFVLFIVDEAGGIPDAVVAAAEGGLANAGDGRIAKLLIAGNPTHLSGPLYRACTRERGLWWVKEISGDPEDPKRAPRVSKVWAQQQIDKYGRDNPWVLVNVFGQFPPGQSNTLLGVDEVEAAARRGIHEADYISAAKVLGVDVARFGDDTTVIMPRQGRSCFTPKVFRNLKTTEVAGQVALAIDTWKPDATFIDATGVGAGVVDQLQQLGYVVQGVEFGGSPLRAEPRLANRRAEMWWSMAEWVKGGGCIPDDAELLGELVSPTYRFDKRGALQLETKEEMKKRGVASPNKADAVALTFAVPVVAKHVGEFGNGIRRVQTGSTVHEYEPLERG